MRLKIKSLVLFVVLIITNTLQMKANDHTIAPPNLLRHVVLFKFKETSTADDIKKVEDAFMALPKKIKTIKSIEFGTNNSPEKLDQGFTHCFILTFKSEKDRNDYLPHPDHKAFGKVLGPHLDKVLVLDYWAK